MLENMDSSLWEPVNLSLSRSKLLCGNMPKLRDQIVSCTKSKTGQKNAIRMWGLANGPIPCQVGDLPSLNTS